MASNYTGNKDAVQSPSPAPAPRVTPIISLPQSSDALDPTNLYQAFKTLADLLTHDNAAVGLDVPVLNASGSGFTTVTATALGGTVTPSGSAHIADGTRFMVQIQTGGAVGTATFKTSMDGGNTYGALQTTAASMTDATSGITLAFSGTFTANGTAAFRSAFTPQAQWIDSLGNRRGLIDHNGFRMGRVTEWRENWDWGIAVSGVQTNLFLPATNYPRWTYNSTANAALAQNAPTATPGVPTSPSMLHTLTTPASGNYSRLISAQLVRLTPSSSIDLACEFELAGSATGTNTVVAMKVGLSNQDTGAIGGAEDGIGFCKRAADTTWQAFTVTGGAATFVNTGISCVDATTHRGKFEFHGSATQYGATVAFFWLDGNFFTITTNTPNAVLKFALSMDVTGSGLTNGQVLAGPVLAVWNRYASIDPGT